MNILEIQHCRKQFGGNEVLTDISLTVSEGQVVSIIGPSGSGKSTLLRCATLLETMDGGNLRYLGKSAVRDEGGKAVYASAACVGFHCASGGEKTIRLPRRARVTMLYPERRAVAADTDRIVFTSARKGMSTTLFRLDTP